MDGTLVGKLTTEGADMPVAPKPWTPARLTELVARRDRGETFVDIATKMNASADACRRQYGKARARTNPKSPKADLPSPRLPEPAPEAGGLCIPESIARPLVPLQVDDAGWWLVLGDVHLPMHSKEVVELAVDEARRRNVVGVLINGDLMDMVGISPFFRVPTRDKFVDEIECGRQFISWLRHKFPAARIIYREGNHEFRLTRYIVDRAAALYELDEVTLPALLRLKEHSVEWVQDKRKVMLGKLTTLHGHEFRKGEGVNPARLAFLRATATVLVGHHHRTSEHHQRTLDDKFVAAWSVGCACYLSPEYDPYSQHNHGFAFVNVERSGLFSVENKRVMSGRIV